MKINDKNLVTFALSNTPVDREGWLMKRGEVNRSFQKRWFLLKGNLLFYFEKKTDREPVGVVILEGCTVELAENEELFAFKVGSSAARSARLSSSFCLRLPLHFDQMRRSTAVFEHGEHNHCVGGSCSWE